MLAKSEHDTSSHPRKTGEDSAWLVKSLGEEEGPKQVEDGHTALSSCGGTVCLVCSVSPGAWQEL